MKLLNEIDRQSSQQQLSLKSKKEVLVQDLDHITDKILQTFVDMKSYEHNEVVKQKAEGKIYTFKQGLLHMTEKVRSLIDVLVAFIWSNKFRTCLNFTANMMHFNDELGLGSKSALDSNLRC